jgi:hypothetical protein
MIHENVRKGVGNWSLLRFFSLFGGNSIKRKMAQFSLRHCDPARARTVDPLIKSQLLYQLSYGVRKGLQI